MQSSEPTAQPGGRRRGLGAVRMCARGGGIAGRLSPLSAVLPADATGSAAVPAGQRHTAPARLPAAFPAMLCAVAPWWSCSPPHTRAKKRATQARSPGLAAAHNGASTSSAWASASSPLAGLMARHRFAYGQHDSSLLALSSAKRHQEALAPVATCTRPNGCPPARLCCSGPSDSLAGPAAERVRSRAAQAARHASDRVREGAASRFAALTGGYDRQARD